MSNSQIDNGKPADTQQGIPVDLTTPEGRTDNANAERFVESHSNDIRFIQEMGQWANYDGKKWDIDVEAAVLQKAREYAAELLPIAQLVDLADPLTQLAMRKFATQSNSKRAITDCLKLAKGDRRISLRVEQIDPHRGLINLRNGTLDLRTGQLRKHDPSDHIFQIANADYVPGADCPQWKAALQRIFDKDASLIDYVQIALGYAASGEANEQILFIGHGNGNNGKSTLTKTVNLTLGDYAHPASFDLFQKSYTRQHPTEIAQLFGKRFVPISELPSGWGVDEARVKQLTGGDMLTARCMRQDFWKFSPTHTFWMSANYLPIISGREEGIWRRIRVIPFNVDLSAVGNVDKDIASRMVRDEAPGILNWIMEGYQKWKEHGLGQIPDAVREKTNEYRRDQDCVSNFVKECCEENDAFSVSLKQLYAAYLEFGGKLGRKDFGNRIRSLGYECSRDGKGYRVRGLRLI